jgi:hypothetical protein
MLFPLYAVQNIVTTSLVILRIFLAHRESKASGSVALNTTSLVMVMRIVVESAAIYTTEIVLAFVFRLLMHPARLLFLYLLTPSTGRSCFLASTKVFSVLIVEMGCRDRVCAVGSACACGG